MIDINTLKFDEKGLIPAIVVDAFSKKVLTLAYMNRESLEMSMEKGITCFFSRSRQKLWIKGETSGNFQHIVSITADCDGDLSYTLTIPSLTVSKIAKVFVWSDFDSMEPLGIAEVIDIK
jgi:phosphoribosyl-AMP cyclohydrolase